MSRNNGGQQVEGFLAAVAHRALSQALLDGSVNYWCRRAREFDSVGTPAAAETARACRAKAEVIARWGLDDAAKESVRLVLAEVMEAEVEAGVRVA